MDWTQVITIIASIVGILGTFMFWLFTKLDKDIADVRGDLKSWVQHLIAMQAEQAKRTDAMNERIDHMHAHLSELVKSRKI
jgi:hypothetical protein